MLNTRPARRRDGGFSLVELMVAVTLGLFVLVGLSTVFLNSARARDETERSNRQIESGRYAMQALSEDLRLAGYLAELDVNGAQLPPPAAIPNPCSLVLSDINAAMTMHIQGWDGVPTWPCIADAVAGSDMVVVRRVASCVSGAAGCDDIAGAPYFQASTCNSPTELGSPNTTDQYRLDTVLNKLDRHLKNCTPAAPGPVAGIHRYLTNIYYVANNDQPGDNIRTLKRAEMTADSFKVVPLAQGIETLQLEYGIDTDGDGLANVFTADPNGYLCAGAACVTNWMNTVSVKVNLLARNPTPSYGGSPDSRSYALGFKADGTANTFGPFSDLYKRHVYQSEVRLNNAAGRREK
jgi:type IV pilus assembly protein PilW